MRCAGGRWAGFRVPLQLSDQHRARELLLRLNQKADEESGLFRLAPRDLVEGGCLVHLVVALLHRQTGAERCVPNANEGLVLMEKAAQSTARFEYKAFHMPSQSRVRQTRYILIRVANCGSHYQGIYIKK